MEFKHKDNGQKGAFIFRDDNKRAAEMTYIWTSDDCFVIDHTEVNPIYQGQGLGKQLVEKAVDFARERNMKILPLCPFARAIFDRIPAYKDVRAIS